MPGPVLGPSLPCHRPPPLHIGNNMHCTPRIVCHIGRQMQENNTIMNGIPAEKLALIHVLFIEIDRN